MTMPFLNAHKYIQLRTTENTAAFNMRPVRRFRVFVSDVFIDVLSEMHHIFLTATELLRSWLSKVHLKAKLKC